MSDEAQVAVYFDFDNIVISRYDELHGVGAFKRDGASGMPADPEVRKRLKQAHVDIKAIMDYATSFGPVAISRAYANWSVPVNASYGQDLMRSSLDLVQMFPLSGSKNGADIRLAIDVIDDISRHIYITHVLVVAGDSDYVSLAQRCRRLGRKVIGVGAVRSVGQHWKSACDEFRFYGDVVAVAEAEPPTSIDATPDRKKQTAPDGALLRKAIRLQRAQSDGGWVSAGGVKSQMMRLNPEFDEAPRYKSFSDFVRDHQESVELRNVGNVVQVRLSEGRAP